MQNRVGNDIPSEKDIQQMVKEIEGVGDKLKKFTLLLSAEERQRTTKMKTNGEPIVDLVGGLAQQHQVGLPRISVDEMQDDLTLAQRLVPLQVALENIAQRIADTILQAESECWWAATAYYTALTRLADADPELERSLKPAVEFFAKRRGRNGLPAQSGS